MLAWQQIAQRLRRRKRETAVLPWGTESPNLDFLRTNAVLMVLVFHVVAFFGIRHFGPFDLEAIGLLGVLFFFVHTSFVLMLSLERQISKLGRQRFFTIFMARRFFRIYPLSSFIVAVIVLFRLPLAGHPWAMNWPHSLGALDVLSNFLLTQNLTRSTPLIGPLWSLPFEMQMYLLLPALFLLARRLKSPWMLAAGWLPITVVIFGLKRLGPEQLTQLLQYVPCFLPGIIAYRLSTRTRPRWSFWTWPLLLWSLAALFALSGRLGVGWLICFVVGMAVPRVVEMDSPSLRRISHLIAKYSYGIYLSHYFCIWLAFTKLQFLSILNRWIIFVVAALVVPFILYHLVEQPFINLGKKVVEPSFAPARVQALVRAA